MVVNDESKVPGKIVSCNVTTESQPPSLIKVCAAVVELVYVLSPNS